LGRSSPLAFIPPCSSTSRRPPSVHTVTSTPSPDHTNVSTPRAFHNLSAYTMPPHSGAPSRAHVASPVPSHHVASPLASQPRFSGYGPRFAYVPSPVAPPLAVHGPPRGPSDPASPPVSSSTDPPWDSHDRHFFHYPPSRATLLRDRRSLGPARGSTWTHFHADPQDDHFIVDPRTGLLPPWTAPRPDYGVVLCHPISSRLQFQDKVLFLSEFDRAPLRYEACQAPRI
jgi:hypothetical protein